MTMNTTTRSSAERFGRWLGHKWRGYTRHERSLAERLVSKGVPSGVTVVLRWLVRLAVLAVLFYVASWFALVLVLLVAAAWAMEHAAEEEDDDLLKYQHPEQPDHRDRLFYDPIDHNDDPDPRFDDR